MPFLRRRAQASESDMRRHKMHPEPSALSTKQLPELPHHLSHTGSAVELPSTASARSADPAAASSANGTTPSIPAPPVTPPHDDSLSSGHATTPSPDDPIDRPDSPPIQEETPRHRRFSMLRFRNASDSQLSTRAKKFAQADEPVPPLPRPPEIITTAPTGDFVQPTKEASRMKLSARRRRSGEESREDQKAKAERRKTLLPSYMPSASSKQSITIEEPPRPRGSGSPPQAGGEPGRASLALPTNRASTSSRSDGSSGDRASGNTSAAPTPTSSFFRLPRRRTKHPEPLFPISHLQRGHSQLGREGAASSSSLADGASDSVRPSISSVASRYRSHSGPDTPTQSRPSSRNGVTTPPGPSPAKALFQKANPAPAAALFRPDSHNSGRSSPTRSHLQLRERSSTMSSLGRASQEDRPPPPATRTSSSTGRKSFGDLLGLSRMRNNSEPHGMRQGALTPATPGSVGSKNNSLQLPRDSVVLPERREDENPGKYLDRLEEVASRSVIAAALSKHTDAFSQAVLRSYMRRFSFFGDPMDMAIRKLLMEAELPKETQQIDRFLQAFANRYHECNPGIYASPDQAYFIAFSLLILHTDVFNKNNRHKMQKADYVKNTRGEGIFDEILDVFYDNITYTPFIHVEDDLDTNGERVVTHKTTKKKSIFPNGNNPEAALKKAAKEPIDPYHLILDNRLDVLRPNLKDVMHLDDHYSYLGTSKSLNLKELQKTFFRTGVLQIVSARSRPDAFMSDKTTSNPEEAQPGVVDIKITKVGLLWRKDAKKKKTRSPWQEWGAILTGAQLYFFRNVAWVKSLMHQYEQHLRQGHDGIPIIFKPPLDQFKPDGLISTDGAVALLDSGYRKHKHAFVYVRHGGMEEVLLADDEDEMNDWLAKLNYAAAFRTSGVRMRGVVGGTYDGQGRRAIRRLDSESIFTPSGEVAVARSRIDQQMAQDILVARRAIMLQKVAEAGELLQDDEKKLELQLRNARHLQIMAPIQPKTREQMLLSAARIAAQLKWTRIEIWKTKCHRDILLLDLEEERELMDLPAGRGAESPSPEKTALSRAESRGSGAAPQSPRSPARLSLRRGSAAAGQPEADSPVAEVFQTPPTSATAAPFHKKQDSREVPPPHALETGALRKGSVSSAVSSSPSVPATPPRKAAGPGSAPETGHADAHPDVDADERDLLQQAGLVESQEGRTAETKPPAPAFEPEDAQGERRERPPRRVSADRLDRSKIRRSLQRTLREGAGHLSHARSKRGKEPAAAGGAAAADEPAQEPDVLTRGSGSFVVHGKKASVVTFGSELQTMSPDERLRQRKASHAGLNGAGGGEGSTNGTPDYRAVLQSHRRGRDERRASAASASTASASTASASTAIAQSFRELHRKYGTAQAARVVALGAGAGLAVPSDEDSDAAVSFSDGTRTPLPTISTEEDEDEDEEERRAGSTEDEGPDAEGGPGPRGESRQAQFYTPEPPASPSGSSARGAEPGEPGEGGGPGGPRERGKDGLPSPPLQAVGA